MTTKEELIDTAWPGGVMRARCIGLDGDVGLEAAGERRDLLELGKELLARGQQPGALRASGGLLTT